MGKRLRRNFLNGECGLNSDFCVVYAKSVLFMQGAFYMSSHCDINMVLIMLQEDSRSGTRHVTYGLAFKYFHIFTL